jgi:hypothetical protein
VSVFSASGSGGNENARIFATHNTALGENTMTAEAGEGNTAMGADAGRNITSEGKFNSVFGVEALENAKWQVENTAYGYKTLHSLGTSFSLNGTLTIGSKVVKSITNTGGILAGSRVSGTGIPTETTVAFVLATTEVELTKEATAEGVHSLTYESAAHRNAAFGAWALSAMKSGTENAVGGHEAMHNSQTATKNTVWGYRALANASNSATSLATENCTFGYEAGVGLSGASSGNLIIGGINPFPGAHSNQFALGNKGVVLMKGNVEGEGSLIVGANSGATLAFYGGTATAQLHVGAVSGGVLAETTTLANKLREQLIAVNLFVE